MHFGCGGLSIRRLADPDRSGVGRALDLDVLAGRIGNDKILGRCAVGHCQLNIFPLVEYLLALAEIGDLLAVEAGDPYK